METAGERKSMGVMEVLILMGFAASFAWYYLIVIGFPGFFPAQTDTFMKRIVQLAAFVGLIAGALFAVHKPKNFSKYAYRNTKTIAWGIVGCVVPALVILESFSISLPVPAVWVIVGATGFGAGYFFTGWEDLSSNGRLNDTLMSMGIAMAAAVGLFLLISLTMTALAQGVMGILLILADTALFYGVSSRRHPKGEGKESEKKGKAEASKKAAESNGNDADADEDDDNDNMRHTFNSKLSALLLLVNIPLGYTLPLIYDFSSVLFFVTMGVAFVSLVVFVVLVRVVQKELTFIMLLRCTVGVSIVALIIAGIYSGLLAVTCIVLFSVWLVLRLAHAGTLVRLTRVQKLNAVYLNVRGKIPGYFGFLGGFVVSTAIIGFNGSDDLVIAGGLIMAIALAVGSLALFPFSESYSKQLSVVPVVIDPTITSAEDIERAKCAELAKRFNLSPREEEILFFIVRGRNARFIAEKLVISESTAKTHIHNIYKKSGIHSQQKFIDIMDELV